VSVRGIDPYSPTPPPVPYGFVELPEHPWEREGEPVTGLPSVDGAEDRFAGAREDNPPIRTYKGRQVDTYA
jgi:hypothetical protein